MDQVEEKISLSIEEEAGKLIKTLVMQAIQGIDTPELRRLSTNRFAFSIDEIRAMHDNARRKLRMVAQSILLFSLPKEINKLYKVLLRYLAISYQGMETITQGLSSNPILLKKICNAMIKRSTKKKLSFQLKDSEFLRKSVETSSSEDSKPFLDAIEAMREELEAGGDRADLLSIKSLVPINSQERLDNIRNLQEAYINTVANSGVALSRTEKHSVRETIEKIRALGLNRAHSIWSHINCSAAKKLTRFDMSSNRYHESFRTLQNRSTIYLSHKTAGRDMVIFYRDSKGLERRDKTKLRQAVSAGSASKHIPENMNHLDEIEGVAVAPPLSPRL